MKRAALGRGYVGFHCGEGPCLAVSAPKPSYTSQTTILSDRCGDTGNRSGGMLHFRYPRQGFMGSPILNRTRVIRECPRRKSRICGVLRGSMEPGGSPRLTVQQVDRGQLGHDRPQPLQTSRGLNRQLNLIAFCQGHPGSQFTDLRRGLEDELSRERGLRSGFRKRTYSLRVAPGTAYKPSVEARTVRSSVRRVWREGTLAALCRSNICVPTLASGLSMFAPRPCLIVGK